jgi:hypothetical protein
MFGNNSQCISHDLQIRQYRSVIVDDTDDLNSRYFLAKPTEPAERVLALLAST